MSRRSPRPGPRCLHATAEVPIAALPWQFAAGPHVARSRDYDADMSRILARIGTVIAALIALLLLLLLLEASFGHDGLLCELGYDKDGDGEGVSGCG
jgi:hypothetical protein